MYTSKRLVGYQAAIASRLTPTVEMRTPAETRPISDNETSIRPLAPTPQQANINKWKNSPNPPQVEGPNYRHSTNRANTQNNSISAKLLAKNPEVDCPFDCHHGIANTHGNLMLPARNKE
ncbi:hypothetical protein [Pseudomonas sp. 31-12]|uniref:hypothetical protein n=1 Tax=Pseudomonas sp. 31-12 TaxID=2201356 RepID=UPI0013A5BC45|nr:hypothetical protein [Pseudomonas sp. 31-12]